MLNLKEFIKETQKRIVFKIHAHPAKAGFKIKGFSKWSNALEIEASELPIKGKANAEIEKKLSEFFQAKCRIISGISSKNKQVLAEASKEKIEKMLEKPH